MQPGRWRGALKPRETKDMHRQTGFSFLNERNETLLNLNSTCPHVGRMSFSFWNWRSETLLNLNSFKFYMFLRERYRFLGFEYLREAPTRARPTALPSRARQNSSEGSIEYYSRWRWRWRVTRQWQYFDNRWCSMLSIIIASSKLLDSDVVRDC